MKFSTTLFRNIKKNKLNTFVMILGMGISFALIIFISGYVYSELSYDKFIKDNGRIFRLIEKGVINGRNLDLAVTSPDFAVSVKDKIPEIDETLRIHNRGNQQLKINDKIIDDIPIIRSDTNIFSFFGLNLISKNNNQPLEDPSNIVISENIALKHFGSVEKALGKNLQIREGDKLSTYTISGIYKDIQGNFHLNFQVIQSVYINRNFNPGSFQGEYIYTYIKTKSSKLDLNALNTKLSQYQYFNAYGMPEAYEMTLKDFMSSDPYLLVIAEPLKEIHFSKHKFDIAIISNKTYVIGAIILSLLVVVISFINFVNLSLASLSKKLKSYGIMKTIGAMKNNFIQSLSVEAILYFVLIFTMATGIFFIINKPFSNYLGFEIKLHSELLVKLIVYIGLFLIAIIFLSNLISYIIINKQTSLELLNTTNKKDSNSFISTRNLFLVIQFSLSFLVISSTLFVNKQIHFFAKADKGFNSENILSFKVSNRYNSKLGAFIEELKTSPLIKNTATSSRPIGNDPGMNSMYFNNVSNEKLFSFKYFKN